MPRYRFHDFELDSRTRRLRKAGEPVPLGTKAFDLLHCLVADPGRVFSRDELLQQLWGGDLEVSDGALSQTVLVLRRALGEPAHDWIRTVARIGYAWEASVECLPDPAVQPADLALDAAARSGPSDASMADGLANEARHARRRRAWVLGLGAMVVLSLSLAALWTGVSAVRPLRPTSSSDVLVWMAPPLPLQQRSEEAWLQPALLGLLRMELHGRGAYLLADSPEARADPDASARLSSHYRVLAAGAEAGRTLELHWYLKLPTGELQTWEQQLPIDALLGLAPALDQELRRRMPALPAFDRWAQHTAAAEAHFAAGLKARHQNQGESARHQLEAALEKAPGLVPARAMLAQVLRELGYDALAVSQARRALADARAQGGPQALLGAMEAELHVLSADHSEAARAWRGLIERFAAQPEWLLGEARARLELGELDAAGRVLAELQPQSMSETDRVDWLLAQRRLDERMGRTQPALARAREALALAESNALPRQAGEAHLALAGLHYRLGDYAAAHASSLAGAEAFARAGDVRGEFRARFQAVQSAPMAGRAADSTDYLGLERLAEATGNLSFRAQAQFAQGNRAQMEGRFSEALARFRAAFDLVEQVGDGLGSEHARLRSASAAIAVGELGLAAQWLEDYAARPGPKRVDTRYVLLHRFDLASALGDLVAASELARSIAELHEAEAPELRSGWRCAEALLALERDMSALAVERLAECDAAIAGGTAEHPSWATLEAALRARLAAPGSAQARAALQVGWQRWQLLPPLARAQYGLHLMWAGLLAEQHAVPEALWPLFRRESSGRLAAEAEALYGLSALKAGQRSIALESLARAREALPAGQGRSAHLIELLALAVAASGENAGQLDRLRLDAWLADALLRGDAALLAIAASPSMPWPAPLSLGIQAVGSERDGAVREASGP